MKHFFPLFLLLFCTACRPLPDQTEATSSTPVPTDAPDGFLVLLDYGHGGADGGAVGTHTGVIEADLNLAIGEQVRAELEAMGVTVRLTRTDEHALADTKQADMQRRGELLSDPKADCTVSIHMNHFSDPSVRGPMVYYQAGSQTGAVLAAHVMDALCLALDRAPRLPNPGNNFVTRVPSAPSILVECGFLSHREEELLLQDAAYQATLARAVSDGIYAFCLQTSCETEQDVLF